MATLPDIAIVITTYIPPGGEHRIRTAIEPTIESWKRCLKYDGNFYVHVADDGSEVSIPFDAAYWNSLIGTWAAVGYSRGERLGVGASLNRAHRDCWRRTPITLYAVDDWSLVANLDLTPWATALLANEDVGCVRLGASMPALRGGTMKQVRGGWGIEFERYAYYWSQRPALYHRRFFNAYGELPEHVDALTVDRQYNARICRGQGPSVILGILCPWQHIASVELGMTVPVLGTHPAVRYRRGTKEVPNG